MLKSFKGFEMPLVNKPGFIGKQKGRENKSFVYTQHGIGFNNMLPPESFLKKKNGPLFSS